MTQEIEGIKADIKRIEFSIWAANDEISRRKVAVKKMEEEVKKLKKRLKELESK